MARDKKHTRILRAVEDHRKEAGRAYLLAKNKLAEVVTSPGDTYDMLDLKIAARNLLEAIDYLNAAQNVEDDAKEVAKAE